MIEHEHIRKEILGIVSSVIPHDQMEQEHLRFVKTWITSGAEIFRIAKPDKPNIHLVSYFVIVDLMTNELLLTDHKKSGLWLPPGGHVEIGEHPRDTVKREIQEELGIKAQFLLEDPLFVTVTDTVGNVARHTDVSLWYVLYRNKSDLIQFDSEEFHRIQWFHSNDIPYGSSDPHMRRFVEKIMNKIKTLK
jgi:8-oxo-dGTP diphosphatase